MKESACIGALSVCCWAVGIIIYDHMVEWGMWAVIVAGLLFYLGAASSVMCLASCLADLALEVRSKC